MLVVSLENPSWLHASPALPAFSIVADPCAGGQHEHVCLKCRHIRKWLQRLMAPTRWLCSSEQGGCRAGRPRRCTRTGVRCNMYLIPGIVAGCSAMAACMPLYLSTLLPKETCMFHG